MEALKKVMKEYAHSRAGMETELMRLGLSAFGYEFGNSLEEQSKMAAFLKKNFEVGVIVNCVGKTTVCKNKNSINEIFTYKINETIEGDYLKLIPELKIGLEHGENTY